MDIDVVVFTLSASVRHIQGHALHPYIMVDAVVPWFDPNIPIGREATATVAAAMAVVTTSVMAAAVVPAVPWLAIPFLGSDSLSPNFFGIPADSAKFRRIPVF